MTSSGQHKDDVKAMGRASEAPFALDRLPSVTRRKSTRNVDRNSDSSQEVYKRINRDLVVCVRNGKPYSVRYD